MADAPRVLDPKAVETIGAYREAGGGRGLEAADRLGPAGVIDDVEASGLRGRGGAGFSTGTKWRSVAANRSAEVPTTVVVNAAEGEPGSFKDRAILRRNPYRVIEGALVAATAMGSDRVVLALKASFHQELARVRAAVDEARAAGWAEGVEIEVAEGPAEYLYGEETALLEVLEGRQPFPRIAAPFRHGMDEATAAAPTLVNNAETMANVPGILAEGPDWFRSMGTELSPGTVVCTVTGRTKRHGVGEVPMGTPLAAVIEEIGGGVGVGRTVAAVLSGVSHPLLPASLLDTPLGYEELDQAGGGLGAAGFIVYDDATDLAAVAQGVSRFLAIESCGQCTPCKQDGLALAELLGRICASEAAELDLAAVAEHAATVADEARCFLAHQHQRVIESVLRLFPDALRAHVDGGAEATKPELITAIVDLDLDGGDGRAVLDEDHLGKQPDWSHDDTDSGQTPADRIDQGAEQG